MKRLVLLWLLFPALLSAADRYTSTTGSDTANDCTNIAAPCNLSNGLTNEFSQMSAGDTLNLCAAACDESGSATLDLNIDGYYTYTIPSGSSWLVPVTIQGYTGETIILQPNGAVGAISFPATVSYTIWKNLILDGSLASETYPDYGNGIGLGGDPGASYNRFQNVEVRYWPQNGIIVGGTYNEFINVHSHHNGRVAVENGAPWGGHGFYIANANNLVDGCESDHNDTNVAGKRDNWGLQTYNYTHPDWIHDNIIRNSKFHDNPNGLFIEGYGTGGNLVYNNIVYDNFGYGVRLYSMGVHQFYNNTVTGTGESCGVETTVTSATEVKNNIIYGNPGGTGICVTSGEVAESNNLTTDPKFVNATTKNFHLQSDSDAIEYGVNLTATFTTDYDGVTRPSGTDPWDAGAYQYAATEPPTITTGPFSAIKSTSLTLSATVASGTSVTAQGACWKTSTGCTTSDSKTIEAGALGAFTTDITGLTPCATWYIRPYATGDGGTGYGREVTIKPNGLCTTSDWTQVTSAVTYDNAATAECDSCGNNVLSYTVTVGNQPNRILLIAVSQGYDRSGGVTSVTVGGSAATHIITQVDSGTNQALASLYYFLNPSVGSNTVAVTMGGASYGFSSTAISLYGVDQDTPLGTAAGATSELASVSVDVTASSTNDLVVSAITAWGAAAISAITPGVGQTSRGSADWVAAEAQSLASTKAGAVGSVTSSGSWTGADSVSAIVAVPVLAAAGNTNNWYTSAAVTPFAVKSGTTPLTKAASLAAMGANKWFWDSGTERLYVQVTGGGNPGAVNIQCRRRMVQ